MNHSNQLIVVIGAAGQQGGAAVRHLLKAGWKVRALTRDVTKPAALALAAQGAELFRADNDDRASLDAAFKGAYGVFAVQNYWLPNVGHDGEVKQGIAAADAAKAAGVQHFVYTSVGAAHRGMGQSHFSSKLEIEDHIKAIGLPYTILRPVAFMDNYNWSRPQITNGTFNALGLRPGKTTQLVAVDDIGAFTALAFEHPQDYLGQTIELAGDELTEPQIAETFTRVIGRPVTPAQRAIREEPAGAAPDPEMLAMFQFFNGQGYDADIPALRRTYPPLKNLELWLRETGWENAEPLPIPDTAAWG
jgi:uncharacterized protein YbjT (DUF2867 family)